GHPRTKFQCCVPKNKSFVKVVKGFWKSNGQPSWSKEQFDISREEQSGPSSAQVRLRVHFPTRALQSSHTLGTITTFQQLASRFFHSRVYSSTFFKSPVSGKPTVCGTAIST